MLAFAAVRSVTPVSVNVPARRGAARCVCTAGCPVSQEIEDNVLPTASGDGLQCGVENVTSTFEVESVGQQGDLAVTVVGMHCLHSRPCL